MRHGQNGRKEGTRGQGGGEERGMEENTEKGKKGRSNISQKIDSQVGKEGFSQDDLREGTYKHRSVETGWAKQGVPLKARHKAN